MDRFLSHEVRAASHGRSTARLDGGSRGLPQALPRNLLQNLLQGGMR